MGLFLSFGGVAQVLLVDDHLALLAFRNENGAIKLMYSMQEGKRFGAPQNRIEVRWADQRSDESHFKATVDPDSRPSATSRPPKASAFQDVAIPTLQEHLAFEKEILGALLRAAQTGSVL
jgi:hypothetical protein